MTSREYRLGGTRRAYVAIVVAAAFALWALGAATIARADLSFEPGSITGLLSSSQAGGHADYQTSFSVSRDSQGKPLGSAKTIAVDLPKGLIGNPQALPKCTAGQAGISFGGELSPCPANTVVGTVTFVLGDGYGGVWEPYTVFLYNIEPYADEPAAMMFTALAFPVRLDISVRSDGDYGITSTITNINEAQPLVSSEVTIWGVPADHQGPGPFSTLYGQSYGGPLPGAKRAPFLSNPSVCDGSSLTTTYRAEPWVPQAAPVAPASGESPPMVGCEKQQFDAALDAAPASSRAASPAGLSFNLSVPQSKAPDGVATPPLKDARIELPAGLSLAPSAANGAGACTDAQVGLKVLGPEQCPDSSKIGTATIDTPLLADPLTGSLYLGSQESNDPQSGKMYRLFLVIAGSGVRIKLEGAVKADPATGQLTVSFVENPQLPFEDLHIDLNSGPRSPLTTPSTCGTYVVKGELTPWSGAPVQVESPFTIDQNCQAASGFTPSLEAGVTSPIGGKSSSFVLDLNRPDGQQNISSLTVTLPKGQLAKLAGVPLCGDAQAATGNCPAGSQVGTTTVAAGSGPDPIYVPQPGKAPTAVYLAGPYKGAPYSIVVKVPAQAGPFDLGTVTVRNALQVDPDTTQVTAISDPLPQILGGIPIAYRKVNVTIDRPDFVQNPTNCEPTSVTSTIVSAQGTVAHPADPYQVANCAALGFTPKLSLQLKGGTTRAKNPALKAVLTAPAGEANIGKAQVILPKGMLVDNRHVNNPCTRVQFNAGAGNGAECPANSILGTATAYTPLLDQPLTGPVYFRSNGGERRLPDLVASLGGSLHVNLVGFIDSVKSGKDSSRVRTRFQSVPDAPVSKFVLDLMGGKKGLLQNSTNLCKSKPVATVKMEGQNGKSNDFQQKMSTACGKAQKGKKKS
jgi:hypothetical protein